MTPEQHLSKGDRLAWLEHDLEAGLAEYRAALELDPAMTVAHWCIGQVHFFAELPRLDEAAAAFREAVRLEPGWSEAHYCLGLVLLQKKQYREAIEEHRKAIALSEKADERLLISLGQCFFEAANYPQAIEAYRKGIGAARFDEAEYHMMLADALYANRNRSQACEEWKRALWLQSGYGQDDALAKEARERLDAHCRE